MDVSIVVVILIVFVLGIGIGVYCADLHLKESAREVAASAKQALSKFSKANEMLFSALIARDAELERHIKTQKLLEAQNSLLTEQNSMLCNLIGSGISELTSKHGSQEDSDEM